MYRSLKRNRGAIRKRDVPALYAMPAAGEFDAGKVCDAWVVAVFRHMLMTLRAAALAHFCLIRASIGADPLFSTANDLVAKVIIHGVAPVMLALLLFVFLLQRIKRCPLMRFNVSSALGFNLTPFFVVCGTLRGLPFG